MTIDFIGHGLTRDKNHETVGNYLVSSFNDDSFDKFMGFSAYGSIGGLSKMQKALKAAASRFEEIKFFFGIDDQITSKEVFQFLLSHKIECFVYHNDSSDVIFHPKIYIFEGKIKNRVIVGSTNLTTHGLFNVNIEAAVVVDFNLGDKSGFKFLNQRLFS